MVILGIAGSLRAGSHNGQLLRAAAAALPEGWELVEWEGLREIPPYDADADGDDAPESVAALRNEIAAADALLIATPEYNHSIPGVLKNALDWASRPFPGSALKGKPAAVVGASTGMFGAVWAQAEVRKVLGATGARVLDEELPVGSAYEAFAADGSLLDPSAAELLGEIVRGLTAVAERELAAA